MSVLSKPYFHNEEAAFAHVEAMLWADGPVCPHCGGVERIYDLGKTRIGLKKCGQCRKQFTVRVGTIFEDSHLPLHKWLQAIHLVCSSKKGISAHQLHRTLEVTYKTAWFLAHRIREAMIDGSVGPMGGEGMTLEADTTFIGGKEKNKHVGKRDPRAIGGLGKSIVHTLVERNGRARSQHISNVTGKTLRKVLNDADRKSSLMTDTAGGYLHVGKEFARHEMVDHGKDEYVRGDAYSNTVEGYFSVLKRGIVGTFHHVSEKHLHRYLVEFDFRYSHRSAMGVEDQQRALRALIGAKGKRLTYRGPASIEA
ncbi:MAG: IS1595 family transposase [Burkholderiales bacterium]